MSERKPDPCPETQRLVRELPARMERLTGRRYTLDLAPLSLETLRALERFVRDAEDEKQRAVRRAATEPWRTW